MHILSGNKQHQFVDLSKPIQQQGGNFNKVNIGADCWVGNASLVMADVAPHCIIASGSVVTKKIEDAYGIYGGNPAKHLKSRIGDGSSKNQAVTPEVPA